MKKKLNPVWVAKWLRTQRARTGLTQNDMARTLGMGRSKFISHELGDAPPEEYEWEGIRALVEAMPPCKTPRPASPKKKREGA